MLADLRRKLNTFLRPPQLPVVQSRGWRWQLTPAGVAVLGPNGPDLAQWITSRLAVVVKSHPARVVYRVGLPGGTVFVKHCRITGPRAWAREVIRPPKARLEFENALLLRDRGLPAVEPLAWGAPASPWPGQSVLITRELTGAIPFQEYLDQHLPLRSAAEQRLRRRQLTTAFAQFLARLHDAGITHPDPHPGNLLLELPAGCEPRFTLIDLHAIRFGQPLPWPATLANLVEYNRWFQLRSFRTERARFWQVYTQARRTVHPGHPTDRITRARQLEQATHQANLRHWIGREARLVRSNRQFRRVALGAVGGVVVRDLPETVVTTLLREPDALLHEPTTRFLKRCETSLVAEIELPTPTGPLPAVMKRVSASWLAAAKNLFRRSAMMRSWVHGHALRIRGLPTPRPLAVLHRYRWGMPATGYLLVENVPAAVGLDEALRRLRDRSARAQLVQRVARLLRTMHDRGVSHRDLKAANILVTADQQPVVIDLVGVRTRRQVPLARRARELARLNASFWTGSTLRRSERLQFVLAYLAAGPDLGVDWKNWWKLVFTATRAKVQRNQRRGRMLG
jgi:tRNA A-37 threonylcarbamoyl transferase component Bud32